MDDPTRAGPGQATFTFFYLHPDLGPNFIRALAKQEPTALRDYLQELDGIAKEKFLMLIGVSDIVAEERMKAGVPIAIIDPRKIKEGSDVSPGSGGLAIFNRAPHPNAAKVYINWLLSKEGQTDFAQVNGYISARLDVPTDHSPWRVPIPKAIKTYTQTGHRYQRRPHGVIQRSFRSVRHKIIGVASMFLVARILLIAMSLGLLAPAAAIAQSSQSWEQILAAAKKEGMVSVIGPQGSETRDALTLAFQKKYPDIRVDYAEHGRYADRPQTAQ